MKEVTISGVTYLPASALAKQYRYTTDYIGQLCRSKKIDAELIGRTWYVNPISLEAHKKAKFTKVPKVTKVSDTESSVSISSNDGDLATPVRITVEPTVSKTTIKAMAEARRAEAEGKDKHFARRIDWQPLRYESDEADLLPRVTKMAPVKMQIDLADSTDITIKSASKSTKLYAEELPTVSLKGSLKVTSLEEGLAFSDTDDTDTLDIPTEPIAEPNEVAITPAKSNSPIKPAEHKESVSFASRLQPMAPEVKEVSAESESVVTPSFSWLLIILFFVVFLATIALLLLLQSEVVATASDSAQTFVFSSADLLDLLRTF